MYVCMYVFMRGHAHVGGGGGGNIVQADPHIRGFGICSLPWPEKNLEN